MENAYTRTPAEALKHFQVTEPNGLSETQVKSLRDKHGKNGMLAIFERQEDYSILTKTNSLARGAANTNLAAYSRAVQRPTGYNIARIRSSVLCACFVRRRGGLDGLR